MDLKTVYYLTFLHLIHGYDPSQEQGKRLEQFRKTCEKYSDDLTYEHQFLFDSNIIAGSFMLNQKNKFSICVAPKTGAQSWTHLMKELAYNNALEATEDEKLQWKNESYHEAFQKSHKAIVVRHPLERILSVYRYTWKDTVILTGLNEKAFAHWLPNRKDQLTPEEDEETINGNKEHMMTFRQFVNLLLNCPYEVEDCALWATEGASYHWTPFWGYCRNLCYHDIQTIIHLDHVQEDKEYLFNLVGANNSIALRHKNKSGEEHSSSMEISKKYYSRLYKSEIFALYQKYRLDFELFGFDPEEYIRFGREDPKSD